MDVNCTFTRQQTTLTTSINLNLNIFTRTLSEASTTETKCLDSFQQFFRNEICVILLLKSRCNLSLSKRCRAGKQEAYQIVIKTNFCISSWAFWLTVVCHMKNIIIKIFLVFCRFGADTTTKRLQWVGTIISTLTTNTWFVITTHAIITTTHSPLRLHRGGGGNKRSCLSTYTAADFQSS